MNSPTGSISLLAIHEDKGRCPASVSFWLTQENAAYIWGGSFHLEQLNQENPSWDLRLCGLIEPERGHFSVVSLNAGDQVVSVGGKEDYRRNESNPKIWNPQKKF